MIVDFSNVFRETSEKLVAPIFLRGSTVGFELGYNLSNTEKPNPLTGDVVREQLGSCDKNHPYAAGFCCGFFVGAFVVLHERIFEYDPLYEIILEITKKIRKLPLMNKKFLRTTIHVLPKESTEKMAVRYLELKKLLQ